MELGRRDPAGHRARVRAGRILATQLAATCGALGLVAAILAHELSHAVVAERLGVEVKEITLWMFGGVSKFDTDARDGGSELRIAIAGPAMSVVVACARAPIEASGCGSAARSARCSRAGHRRIRARWRDRWDLARLPRVVPDVGRSHGGSVRGGRRRARPGEGCGRDVRVGPNC